MLGVDCRDQISSAKDTKTGGEVAIKKVTKIFDKPILAKRALRELKLLKHFNGHENVCFGTRRGGNQSSGPYQTRLRRLLLSWIWTSPTSTISTKCWSQVGLQTSLFAKLNCLLAFQVHYPGTHGSRPSPNHPVRTATHRFAFPILHLPSLPRLEVYPLGKCSAPRFEAWWVIIGVAKEASHNSFFM